MESDKILQLTLPLSPYLKPGEKSISRTKRIRPADSLDLRYMLNILKKNEVAQVIIQGKPWSVVSVYSPYSPDIHVMVMESSTDRYLPSPEYCFDAEGETLMRLWDTVLEFTGKRKVNKTIHAGFNWSPRSWGKEEEKGGFQSIPTKWHTMIWAWPDFPEQSEKTEYSQWVSADTLTLSQRRIFGYNNYALLMGKALRDRCFSYFDSKKRFKEIFGTQDWNVDNRGLFLDFDVSIRKLFTSKGFFPEVLKPLSFMLDQFMRELTHTFTTLNCVYIDRILKNVEKGVLNSESIKQLRALPEVRTVKEIKKIFAVHKLPQSLLSVLLFAVNNRCKTHGTPEKWWRKGFAYAMVFSSPCNQEKGRLRIMPGVYIGPGGVVEAKGIDLKRPEERTISMEEIQKKSRILWDLGADIKNRF